MSFRIMYPIPFCGLFLLWYHNVLINLAIYFILILGKMNLDSILKSRDITLPTKVRLVKAMVFPVVMYGCKSWTVKKAECQRIDVLKCGVGEDS